ncbi:DinB family protein [Kribbella sp. HUAS MG21]|uniref:DinB family protein n=1 Tax=Kribbella sp. HUAS MG21 TaxID=3160966 RepID=UPI003306137B
MTTGVLPSTPAANPPALPEPPIAGSEIDTLLGALERNRRTFAWKCGNLDAAGLNKQHPPSTVTLGGLLKHLALVEDEYFTGRLLGKELGAPWDTVDWDAFPDWEWSSAADDSPEELMELWQSAVDRSRAAVAEVLARGGVDQLAQWKGRGGQSPSLRFILVDLIEEYARHTGHADLIRESVDGLTGEGVPAS